MSYNMIVMVKQVPDTHNITGEAMKPDGTVNRAALPAIFNPEDLNALEEALKIKENHGGTITVITMGPQSATQVLRESLYRGVDDVILISDRKFAGADTLATSYVLFLAIKKIGNYDLVLGGRQAIDGDTAQVGPQTAEKLKINQITGINRIIEIKNRSITVERLIEGGYEVVKTKMPVLLTITAEANTPRPPSVKKVLAYKNAMTELELKNYIDDYMGDFESHNNPFIIKLWDHSDVGADLALCGLSGSPTKVKKVDSVVLDAGGTKQVENSPEGLKNLVSELMAEHIIG